MGKIIEVELNGAVYDDADAKAWSVHISDKVQEKVTGTLSTLQLRLHFS